MTLRHLKIFIEVYKEMSVTKASQKLHLAQPSVSLAIRELEEAYQIRLFDRIGRRLYVTEEGHLFFSYASHIVSAFEQMESAMTSSRGIGSIRIGASMTIGNFLIPDAVSRFQEAYPACKVFVCIQNSGQIARKVMKNDLDFGVVEDNVPYEQLICEPFMEDRLYFICGTAHPLASQNSVSLEQLCRYPFFMREPGSASREIPDHFMKSHGLDYELRWESTSNQALIHALQKQPGIAVLSGRVVDREVREGKLKILPIYPEAFARQFSIIRHRQKYISATVRHLMDLVKSARGHLTVDKNSAMIYTDN